MIVRKTQITEKLFKSKKHAKQISTSRLYNSASLAKPNMDRNTSYRNGKLIMGRLQCLSSKCTSNCKKRNEFSEHRNKLTYRPFQLLHAVLSHHIDHKVGVFQGLKEPRKRSLFP